jgi:hypothetical protein
MINLKEILTSIGIGRYSLDKDYICIKQFTEEDLKDCRKQRFSDLSGIPYKFDFEVGRTYDIIEDWRTLNDDGYMWITILKERYQGGNIITDDMILGSVYSMIILSNFRKKELDEIREEKIDELFDGCK